MGGGGFREGEWGGGIGGAVGGGASGRVGWGGGVSKWGNSGWWWWWGEVQVGRFGVLGGGGGHRFPLPPLALPLTIPSP